MYESDIDEFQWSYVPDVFLADIPFFRRFSRLLATD
jgi:hypothetical protein